MATQFETIPAVSRAVHRERQRLIVGVLGILIACLSLAHCGGDDEDLSCNELESRATQRVSTAQLASRACSADADCTLGNYAVHCHDDCGSPVSLARAGVPNVQAAQKAANDEYCEAFEQKGCTVIAPPCVPPTGAPVAACQAGVCVVGQSNVAGGM